eukprot:TRINITY_DN5525_c1_g1_i1.p1 TRINITY_DN5525_c1_g1~~TRINITY_DN5525_c1_g1_i1.p1  ORF type:complete len:258 (-),score=48.16 TRINITY_DN5525_c1_g1_i1:653-1426(-)
MERERGGEGEERGGRERRKTSNPPSTSSTPTKIEMGSSASKAKQAGKLGTDSLKVAEQRARIVSRGEGAPSAASNASGGFGQNKGIVEQEHDYANERDEDFINAIKMMRGNISSRAVQGAMPQDEKYEGATAETEQGGNIGITIIRDGNRPLPTTRGGSLVSYTERVESIPGKLSNDDFSELFSLRRSNEQEWTPEKLANKFSVDVEKLEQLIEINNTFEIWQKKDQGTAYGFWKVPEEINVGGMGQQRQENEDSRG